MFLINCTPHLYIGNLCSQRYLSIANRLSSAGCAYHRLQRLNVWQDKHISFKIKLVLYRVIVQSALLYGIETWAITGLDAHKMEVFQMRYLRRLSGLSLLDRVNDATIRAMCNVHPTLSLTRYRSFHWLGHIGRMDGSRFALNRLFPAQCQDQGQEGDL